MSTLNQQQILFALRASGYDEYLGKVDSQQLINAALSDPIGRTAAEMALKYGLEYDTSGNITLRILPVYDRSSDRGMEENTVALLERIYRQRRLVEEMKEKLGPMEFDISSSLSYKYDYTPESVFLFLEKYGKYFRLTQSQRIFVINCTQWGKKALDHFYNHLFATALFYPIARLAADVALKYSLDYNSEKNIILKTTNRPTIESLRTVFQTVGMWIPYMYRDSPEHVFEYVQSYGYLYKYFDNVYGPKSDELQTLYKSYAPAHHSIEEFQTLQNNDLYLIEALEGDLTELFTDFGLFRRFPFIGDHAQQFTNREDIIKYIVNTYRPAGEFVVYHTTPETYALGEKLLVRHFYKSQYFAYSSDDGFESLVQNGYLYNGGQIISPVGLYQLAAGFWGRFYYESTPLTKHFFEYFLNQIHIAEQRGDIKLRFGNRYTEFNEYLEAAGLPDISKLQI